MKDAMSAMKAELGEDAVILHSKKYKEGGILGIGSREVVEITAAVEESSMPKKVETPRLKHPTVATSSVLSRYKTDGTAQAVEDAQRSNDNLDDENSARPVQLERLAEKVSEQKKSLTTQDNFEHILQETQEDSLAVNLTAKNETIRNEELEIRNEETPAQIEEIPQPVEEVPAVEETPAQEEISQPVEETPAQEETPQPVEETLTVEETQPVEETPASEEKPQLVVEISKPEEIPQPVETSNPEEKSQAAEETPPQQATTFTQEQMAQTQAMIMAQFNQMQMMQQAAIAQAQAQAASETA